MARLKLKKNEPTESEVLNAVGEYLTRRKHFFFRTNNAPTFQPDGHGGGFFRKLSTYSVRGVPDIVLVGKECGTFIGLEIKRSSGRPSEDQIIFKRKCEELGAEYYFIKSIDDLIEVGL
jgi:hypothetical protein